MSGRVQLRAEQAERERDELRAEVERLRAMWDTTRHRVLRALGEHDKGRSWSWIEWALAELKAQTCGTCVHRDTTRCYHGEGSPDERSVDWHCADWRARR